MAEQVYLVKWKCVSCGHEHSFRHTLEEFGDWPNKFEDLRCENKDCGQVQDVPFRKCTVEPFAQESSQAK